MLIESLSQIRGVTNIKSMVAHGAEDINVIHLSEIFSASPTALRASRHMFPQCANYDAEAASVAGSGRAISACPGGWFGVASYQGGSTSKVDMTEKYNPELGEQLFVTFYERSSTSR